MQLVYNLHREAEGRQYCLPPDQRLRLHALGLKVVYIHLQRHLIADVHSR